MAKPREVLRQERPAPAVRLHERGVRVALRPDPERLVQRRERRVHQWDRVPRGEHEAICEWQPGLADIPAHRPREQRRQQQVHLGPRAPRVTALTVVEREIDQLVDDVLHHFPYRERRLRVRVEALEGIHGCAQ